MGGCQNYGLVLVPIIIRRLIFRVPKKGIMFRAILNYIIGTLIWNYRKSGFSVKGVKRVCRGHTRIYTL